MHRIATVTDDRVQTTTTTDGRNTVA